MVDPTFGFLIGTRSRGRDRAPPYGLPRLRSRARPADSRAPPTIVLGPMLQGGETGAVLCGNAVRLGCRPRPTQAARAAPSAFVRHVSLPFPTSFGTFACNALAAGVGTFELARYLGTSVEMIERTYGHLVTGADDAFRNRLDSYGKLAEASTPGGPSERGQGSCAGPRTAATRDGAAMARGWARRQVEACRSAAACDGRRRPVCPQSARCAVAAPPREHVRGA